MRRMLRLMTAMVLAACFGLALGTSAGAAVSTSPGRLVGLIFKRPTLVSGPPVVVGSVFSDAADSPAEPDFALLAALDIFRGASGPNGPAYPKEVVSRAELAAIAVRVLGYESLAQWYLDQGYAAPFDDAAEIPAWARGYARAAAALGLVHGFPGPDQGLFRAGQSITFGDAVAVLARTLRFETAAGDWPAEEVEALRESLIALLDKDPGDPITREDMAILVSGALRLDRYNPDTGKVEPDNSFINRSYVVVEGAVDEVVPELRRLYGAMRMLGNEVKKVDLAQQVFLRGADSLTDLSGRTIWAVANPRRPGLVYIEVR